MAFCSKCGFELREGDAFCAKCGQSFAEDAELMGLSSPVVQMTAQESIDLADKLGSIYENLRVIREEISDCEEGIRKNTHDPNPPRYSAFRFFWPFLIIAVVAFWVVFFICIGILLASNGSADGVYVSEFIALIAAVIVLIAGGTRARNKRDELNASVANYERTKSKKKHDLNIKLDELKKSQRAFQKSTEEYSTLVPAALRNKKTMERVKMLIQQGQAQTFTEAIDICRKPAML